MCMGTKTITVMDDAYNLLLSRKNKDESFSEVIRKMAEEKGNVMKFAGAWKHISDEEISEMKNRIYSVRRKATTDLLKKLSKLEK